MHRGCHADSPCITREELHARWSAGTARQHAKDHGTVSTRGFQGILAHRRRYARCPCGVPRGLCYTFSAGGRLSSASLPYAMSWLLQSPVALPHESMEMLGDPAKLR